MTPATSPDPMAPRYDIKGLFAAAGGSKAKLFSEFHYSKMELEYTC